MAEIAGNFSWALRLVLAFASFPAMSAAQGIARCAIPDSMPIAATLFEGLRITRPQVVKRELGHQAGQPFLCRTWEEEKIRLEDLDIFADVRIDLRESTLVYAFRELPPYIPFVAVAKTDQDGFSIGPALASLNLLGTDIRAEFITRFGGTNELQASLSSPWIGTLPFEYDVAVLRVDSYNAFEDFHEDSWRVKLDLTQRLSGPSRLLYNGEIFALRAEKLAAGRSDPTLSAGRDFIPRLGGGYLWDNRDRKHHTRKGIYQEMRLTQNGGWLGGPADYMEALSDSRVYLPWAMRNVLYLSALYQYRTGEMGQTFPVYDRFHAGGVNTLRGFARDTYQGKSEWIANLENRVDLVSRRPVKLWKWDGYFGLQGVAGIEAASLWGHNALMERNAHLGVYAGLHLLLAGIDRIRLEIGSNTARLELRGDLGILEKAEAQRFRSR